jgi:hypothetical protein
VLSDQFKIVEFFNNIFHDFLCAFRKGHGCQTTLLRLLEDWQSAHDKNCYVAAILKDLSKAFDCLPHDILLSKLAAYKISSQSVKVLEHNLTGRKQQIKLRVVVSSPQGSLMGPLLFIFFINDIFYFNEHGTLYKYRKELYVLSMRITIAHMKNFYIYQKYHLYK